jgi:hypothetical protein
MVAAAKAGLDKGRLETAERDMILLFTSLVLIQCFKAYNFPPTASRFCSSHLPTSG